MNKSEYSDLRKTLDFSISSQWIPQHVLVDLLISVVPVTFFAYRRDSALLDWSGVCGCLFSALMLAALYFRGFSAMHEAVHSCLHPVKKWNDRAGIFYGVLCFLPFEYWREIHLQHHQWTGNVEKDPVMKLVRDFNGPPTAVTRLISFFWKSWVPVLATMQEYVFWFVCTGLFLKEKKRTTGCFFSLAMPLLVWSLIFYAVGLKWTCAIFVPSFFIYLVMVEVINFPHHLNLPQESGDAKLPLWEQYRAARSCIYPRWMSRIIFLNFNYHTEHHLFPTLPWRQLDGLSLHLRDSLAGYNFCIGNSWILKNRARRIEDVLRPETASKIPEKIAA